MERKNIGAIISDIYKDCLRYKAYMAGCTDRDHNPYQAKLYQHYKNEYDFYNNLIYDELSFLCSYTEDEIHVTAYPCHGQINRLLTKYIKADIKTRVDVTRTDDAVRMKTWLATIIDAYHPAYLLRIRPYHYDMVINGENVDFFSGRK